MSYAHLIFGRVYLSTAAAAIYMACQLKVNSTDYRTYEQIAEWTGTNSQQFFFIFLHQLRQ
jgi:transcription initiation factor TFIIIB Brf1 subunit/transcription initiation factor TFIIB